MDNKFTLNKVKNRFLFISPSVQSGLESEGKISDYDIIDKLGEGSFGKVYRAKHKKTGAIYAIKAIDKMNKNNQEGKPYFRREIEIMYKVKHPNIVRLFGHFEDDQHCYFVLEYIPKGNLFTILSKQKTKCFDSTKVANFIKDLICSVFYLHNMEPPIIHRDIKPENVLLNEKNVVKLTDFGWSNYIDDSGVRSTYCGTPVYLAPEMIKETGHDGNLDIWCIGILMFELLTGNIPFQGSDQQTLQTNILRNKICWPKDMDLSAKDLISKILKSDPNERISLCDMLKHPFFIKNVEKPTENLFKPGEEGDDKSIYVLSKDTPQLLQTPLIKKKDQTNQNNISTGNSTGNISTDNKNILTKNDLNMEEKEYLNKIILEYKKLQKEFNNLKDNFDDVSKKNEDLTMKQNYHSLEKNQIIKERDEIEGQKLEYQKHIAELKQNLIESSNMNNILKNELNIKENKIVIDGKDIERLNYEIEDLILSKEEERKKYNDKIESLEKKLCQNIDNRESQLLGEMNELRSSLKVVFDESENNMSHFRESGIMPNHDEKLRIANEELMLRLESLKNEFSKEKEKYNLLLKNKDDELKRLIFDKSTKKDSDSRKFDLISNKYENVVKSKDAEIENLKAKIKRLENINSVNDMRK